MSASAIFSGSVMHRRLRPKPHHFRYACFWLMLDLDELDGLAARFRLLKHNANALFSVRDRDYGDGSDLPLRAQIERYLAAAGIDSEGGSIAMLCMPRTMGFVFNPLTVYFCRDAEGELQCLVYEVHNTFGERFTYVMPVTRNTGTVHQQCEKAFFVSPFLDMGLRYFFAVSQTSERLSIAIRAAQGSETMLLACLSARHHTLSDRNLLKLALQMPALSIKVIAAIHWEALRLWLKGIGLRPRRAPPIRPPRAIIEP